jgi:hypothetical protein
MGHPREFAVACEHGLIVLADEHWQRSLLSAARAGESNWPFRSSDFWSLTTALARTRPAA